MKYLGLSGEEVSKLQLQYGTNELQKTSGKSIFQKIKSQFSDLMVMILIGASLIAFFLGENIDAGIILGIVLLNACIGFFQEWKTERTLEALKKMISPLAKVIREGKEEEILASMLVPGDILVLREGDRISADAEILESTEMRAEESALTGESVPVSKKLGDGVFMGTSCVFGYALAKVLNIGMQTKFGSITRLTTETEEEQSPLQKEMISMGFFIGKLTGGIVISIFLLDYFSQKASFIESFLLAISVAVAAVPEGLPATITIALALGVQRLAKKNAILKKLSSVETLGGTTVICSDKTGTLTKNEMTVIEGFVSSGDIFISGSGYDPLGEYTISSKNKNQALFETENLFRIATLCNDARLSWNAEEKKWKIFGDPTEGALITASEKYWAERETEKKIALDEKAILVKSFPFSSDRKRMSILRESSQNGERELLVKGASEMILSQCTHIQVGEKIIILENQEKEKILQKIDAMSERALRVLAFARRPILGKEKFEDEKSAEQNLVFIGCLGMIDPPREEVQEAVKICQMAGIRVIVITGDNPKTAKAIAEKIGIFHQYEPRLITGNDLAQFSDTELLEILGKEKKYIPLFARTAPEDKRRIVDMLQNLGEIVTVTGDGVNDAPALKKANIGVAMGSGTEVAKEAAQMVLLTDSFANIVSAIGEGRVISNNLRKFVWFIFSGNLGELVLVLGPLIFHLPAALTVGMILLVDLGTDVLPSIALGIDNTEKGIMEKPPRDPNKRLMQPRFIFSFVRVGIVVGLSALSAFFLDLYVEGWNFTGSPSEDIHMQAMTVAFVTIVLAQLWNGFSARSSEHSAFQKDIPSNIFLWIATAISLLLVGFVLYIPFFQTIFQTTPLGLTSLSLAIFFSSFAFIFEEIRKSAGK